MILEHYHSQVLILGSGSAGLRAAIAAREKGLEVTVISKGAPGMGTSTVMAGGVFAGRKEEDTPDSHRERTLQAGRGINQIELVDLLVEESPKRLKELVDWGIRGEIRDGYLFCHGRAPVWGKMIVDCLVDKARGAGVRFRGGLLAAALKVHNGAAGVLAFSIGSEKWVLLTADALVLAMGGAGALYQRHDNPQRMMGEGYALALEAGALLQNMEFVQFYPLGLAESGALPYLIPPRLADFGRLTNSRGEDIYVKYDIRERPAAERARDRLSQALFAEIYREGSEICLDLSEVDSRAWRCDPLSWSTREILGERCGMMHRPVRVAPMAHHVMGGVKIDADGATSAPGLYAAGEITGGVHGANRLGGNALTETLVFGARAGENAAAWAEQRLGRGAVALVSDLRRRINDLTGNRPGGDLSELKGRLRETLWKDGGIVRNREGLRRAQDEVEELCEQLRETSLGSAPHKAQRALELYWGARSASLIIRGAMKRDESRGAHFREDYPEQNDERWRGSLEVCLSSDGQERWTFRPSSAQ